MLDNRSIPRATVIPVLLYDDVAAAAEWLCRAFGFTVRLRIANHRVQLNVGEGAVVVAERTVPASAGIVTAGATHSVMVRVDDADAHYERALREGAHLSGPPINHPYGERQYSAQDPGGHRWTFSQSIADVPPESWGGEPGTL